MCHDSSVTIAQWVCRSKPKLIERKHYHSKLRNTIDCGWGQTPDCVTASSRSLFGCSDPQRFNKWAYRARDHIEWQTTSVRLVWKSRYRPRMSSLCRRCNIELAAGPVGLSHVIGAIASTRALQRVSINIWIFQRDPNLRVNKLPIWRDSFDLFESFASGWAGISIFYPPNIRDPAE